MGRWGSRVQIPPLRPFHPLCRGERRRITGVSARTEFGVADQDMIATERLVLRRFRAEDASAFHEIMSNAKAMRYWSTPPHGCLAETERWIAATIEAVRSGRGDDFVVVHDGKIIGKAGLWADNELGMIFAPSVWGQGYAREAVAAVIARAFGRGRSE